VYSLLHSAVMRLARGWGIKGGGRVMVLPNAPLCCLIKWLNGCERPWCVLPGGNRSWLWACVFVTRQQIVAVRASAVQVSLASLISVNLLCSKFTTQWIHIVLVLHGCLYHMYNDQAVVDSLCKTTEALNKSLQWVLLWQEINHRSLLQNIVSFIGLFCKRDL